MHGFGSIVEFSTKGSHRLIRLLQREHMRTQRLQFVSTALQDIQRFFDRWPTRRQNTHQLDFVDDDFVRYKIRDGFKTFQTGENNSAAGAHHIHRVDNRLCRTCGYLDHNIRFSAVCQFDDTLNSVFPVHIDYSIRAELQCQIEPRFVLRSSGNNHFAGASLLGGDKR